MTSNHELFRFYSMLKLFFGHLHNSLGAIRNNSRILSQLEKTFYYLLLLLL